MLLLNTLAALEQVQQKNMKFPGSRVFGNLVLGINCISGTAKEPT
jgi:hypothetical protein